MIPVISPEGEVIGELHLNLACFKLDRGSYIWRVKIYAYGQDEASRLKFTVWYWGVKDPSELTTTLPFLGVILDPQPVSRWRFYQT